MVELGDEGGQFLVEGDWCGVHYVGVFGFDQVGVMLCLFLQVVVQFGQMGNVVEL